MNGCTREARNAATESRTLAQVDPLATRVHLHLQRRVDTQLNFQCFASLLVAGVTEVGAGVRLPDGSDDECAIANDVPVGAVQSCLVSVRLTVRPSGTSTETRTLCYDKYYSE